MSLAGKCTAAITITEEPSIILRLSCLLHVLILIDVLLYVIIQAQLIIINAIYAGTRP